MKLSIIIPAFNEEHLLGHTLAHLNAVLPVFARAGWEFEIVVCDNNSLDQTAAVARAAGAVVVFEPVNQIGRARNRGASVATGEWLLFLDADSQPSAGLLEEVVAQIKSGNCLAGGSTVRLAGKHPLGRLATAIWNRISRSRHWLAGSFIFCETATFRKIGGFNPELFAGEELDLSERLKELGRETGKQIVILHRHPLLTSDRKMRLYSGWDYARLLWRVVRNPEQTLRDREACYIWYDGRR